MPNEVDAFLGLDQDNSDPFNTEKNDPFTNEPQEVASEEKTETEEKPVPFHKDPKVQRFIEKEIGKRLADVRPASESRPQEQVDSEEKALVDAFATIIGNQKPESIAALDALSKTLKGFKESASRQVMDEIDRASQAEAEEENEAKEEIAEAFDQIEEDYGVDLTSNSEAARRTRNDFIEFIKEVAPKDRDGEVTEFPDFDKTFSLFQRMRKPEPNNRARSLASRSMARSSDAPATKTTGNSWKDVDKIFSNLGK